MILSDGRELVIRDCFRAQNFGIEMFNGGIDPLIMVDHFRMTAPTFPPHPHAGLSAVTYVFPESSGAHMNYDSLHAPISIEPGDIHWFASGSGAVHTEQPKVEGVEVHALQIFVNLPISMKRQRAYASHITAADIPVYLDIGGTVRVVSGGFEDFVSPLETPTPFMLLDCHGNKGMQNAFPMRINWNYFLYSVDGQIEVSLPGRELERAMITLGTGQSLGFSGSEAGENRSLVVNYTINSHYVLIGGESLNEPYHLGGPIVMESAEANLERFEAYRNGEFGEINGY